MSQLTVLHVTGQSSN